MIVRRETGRGHMLSLKLQGPPWIAAVMRDETFVLESLENVTRSTLHSSRLRVMFSENSGADLERLKEHFTLKDSIYQTVQSILGTEEHKDVLYGRVKWDIPEYIQVITLQNFAEICEDIPEMIVDYIRTSKNQYTKLDYAV